MSCRPGGCHSRHSRWSRESRYSRQSLESKILKKSILLIEHDMKFVSGLCDELTVLNFGTVLAQGKPEVALNDPEVIKAYIGG